MNRSYRLFTTIIMTLICFFIFADNVQELLDQANKLEKEDKLSEAIEIYDKVLELDPNSLKAERKKIFLQMKLEKAKAREEGESFDSLLRKANKYLAKFALDEAIEFYEKALKLKPYNSEALLGKAEALYYSFRTDEAIAAYEEVLKIDEYNVNALTIVALHYQYNFEYEKSALFYDKLFFGNEVPIDKINVQNCLDACYVYNKQKLYDKAHQVLDIASAEFPENKDVFFQKADTYFNQGKYQESLDWFNRSQAIEETSNIWYRKGVSLYKLDRNNEAMQAFDRSLELDPGNFNSDYFKAVIHVDFEEYFKAISHLNKYLDVFPNDIPCLEYRMACYVRLEMYQNALIDVEKILEIKPNHENARLWRTQIQKFIN